VTRGLRCGQNAKLASRHVLARQLSASGCSEEGTLSAGGRRRGHRLDGTGARSFGARGRRGMKRSGVEAFCGYMTEERRIAGRQRQELDALRRATAARLRDGGERLETAEIRRLG